MPNMLLGCTCGDVRLSGGESYFEGRVEVCLEGLWLTLTLCDESWNDFVAEVVCSQLGFLTPGKCQSTLSIHKLCPY